MEIKINTAHCSQDPGLNARKIWCALYPDFIASLKGTTPTHRNMDSFLCDIPAIARVLSDHINEFWWELGNKGYTAIRTFMDPYNSTHHIKVEPDSITITKLETE